MFADLESVYPDGPDTDQTGREMSFEELRAKHRGLLDRDWSKDNNQKQMLVTKSTEPLDASIQKQSATDENTYPNQQDSNASGSSEPTCHLSLPYSGDSADTQSMAESHPVQLDPPPKTVPLKDEPSSQRKLKKDDRANRTRKIMVMEVKGETQTSMDPCISSQILELRLLIWS